MWALVTAGLKAVAAFFGWRKTVENIDSGIARQNAADKEKAIKDAEIAQIIRDRNAGLSHDELVARLRADGQG